MENGTRVRVPTYSLPDIEIRHLASGKDMTIVAPENGAHDRTTITGYTEWVGEWNGRSVSIGWDWAIVGKTVIVLNPNEIRTNIQLVTDTGQDDPLATTSLLHWIESIPWREIATRDVLDPDEKP